MEKWNSAGKKKKSNPAAAEPAQSDAREDFFLSKLISKNILSKILTKIQGNNLLRNL